MMERQFDLRWYVWAFTLASAAYSALGRWDEALENGKEALRKAEEFSDNSLICISARFISLSYTLKGDLNQAVKYGEMAVNKAPTPGDKVWARGFLAFAWSRTGEPHRGLEAFAEAVSINRAGRMRSGEVGFGMWLGEGYFLAGDYEKASQTLKEALELAERSGMKWCIGVAQAILGQVALKTNPTQASYHFEQSIANLQKCKYYPSETELLRSILMLTRGNLRQGIKIAEDLTDVFLKEGSIWGYVTVEYLLGNFYLQIVLGAGPKTLAFLAKNIAFLIKSFPRASEKAEYHLNKAIETAKEFGAKLILGQAYNDLGLLHKAKKRGEKAEECISKAIQIFKQCKAEEYLKQANEALESLV
jgi:tetratricopeptide (TPR) repeat protein